MVKEFLSRHRVPFTPKPVSIEANRLEFLQRTHPELPMAVVGEVEIPGFNIKALTEALAAVGLIDPNATGRPQKKPVSHLKATAPISDGLVVANFLADGVTLLNARTGGYLGRDLESSFIEMDGKPRDVEAVVHAGTFASINHSAGTVTFLSLKDGGYLHGDYASSTKRCGAFPLDALPHPTEPILFVGGSDDRCVTLFDARTGDYLHGTFEQSTFSTSGRSAIMCYNPEADILYVRLSNEGVCMLQGRTMKPLLGDLDSSTFKVRFGFGVAVNSDRTVLFAPEAAGANDGIYMYNPHTGKPLFGTREASYRPSASTPLGVAAHPTKPILYLACAGTKTLELRDSRTGEYLFGTAERSSVPIGGGARDVLVDTRDDTVFVSCFDDACVIMVKPETGEYRFGTREASTIATGKGPRAMALLG